MIYKILHGSRFVYLWHWSLSCDVLYEYNKRTLMPHVIIVTGLIYDRCPCLFHGKIPKSTAIISSLIIHPPED